MSFNVREILSGFGWHHVSINGHRHETIEDALLTYSHSGLPLAVIAHTIKGKGVSFMEDHLLYHYKNIDDETYAKAMAELV